MAKKNNVPKAKTDFDYIALCYTILPDYWAIWKNRFGTYSVGEVGEVLNEHGTQSSAAFVGSATEVWQYCDKKFNLLPF